MGHTAAALRGLTVLDLHPPELRDDAGVRVRVAATVQDVLIA